MERGLILLAALAVATSACTDSPVSPAAKGVPKPLASQLQANPPCTVHWANGVSGSWFDNTKWSPAVVPGSSDVACIDAAGTYTVTMDPAVDATPVAVTGLNIGGAGASPTVSLAGTSLVLNASMGVEIASGGTLTFAMVTGAQVLTGSGTTNNGTISVTSLCGGCSLQNRLTSDLTNTGALSVSGLLTLDKVDGAYSNIGSLVMAAGTGVVIPATATSATFAQAGGSVSAPTQALVSMLAGTFTLSGGTLSLSAQTALPVVRLNGANLVLDPALTGTQDIAVAATAAGTSTISGDVPTATTVWVTGPGVVGNSSIAWLGDPVVAGTVRPDVYNFGGTNLTITGSGTLTNNGSFIPKLVGGQSIRYAIDIANHGTFDASGATYLEKVNGAFDNYATVSQTGFAVLTVSSGTTFRSHSTGTMSSNLLLRIDGGHLTGTGNVSSIVVANGGTVAPGEPIGILNATGFSPDASSTLTIDVTGPTAGTDYDQLITSGQASMNGTLAVVATPAAASCGFTYDVIVHSSPGGTGAFTSVTGLAPAPGAALRLIYANTSQPKVVRLIGYGTASAVTVAPNPVVIAEGQGGVPYSVCLDHAPSASVTVTPSPDAQETVAGGPLVFTSTNWQYPQYLTVTAVDDGVFEGPHAGTITHSVSSADASYNNYPVTSLATAITDNDGSADLRISIAKAPPPLTVNTIFTVDLKVTNNGPTLSTGSAVTISPLDGFRLQSVVGATCTATGGVLTCNIAGLGSGANAVFTLKLKAIKAGVFQKTITVTGQEADPNAANNTLVKNITVN